MPSVTMVATMVTMAAIMVVTMEAVTMAADIMVVMVKAIMDTDGDTDMERDTAIMAIIEYVYKHVKAGKQMIVIFFYLDISKQWSILH